MGVGDSSLDSCLCQRVFSEYREMPGLSLTREQACRLWACEPTTFDRVAQSLVERHWLRWSRDHRLVWNSLEP
jgi:hypothetical protein